MKRIRIILRCILGLVFIICILGLVFVSLISSPVSKDTKDIIFVVSSGENINMVASNLSGSGLINSKISFIILYAMSGGNIEVGEYKLSPSMPQIHILKVLLKGSSSSVRKK